MLAREPASSGVGLLCLAFAGVCLWAADAPTAQEHRDQANKAVKDGNYKNAYDALRAAGPRPQGRPRQGQRRPDHRPSSASATSAASTRSTTSARPSSPPTPRTGGCSRPPPAQLRARTEWYGYIVAGKFYRGYKRGGGKWVNTVHRDRVRALQLMQQAMPLSAKDANKADAASFYLDFGRLLLNGTRCHEAWRLQYLTDLTKLPDYEDGYWYGGDSRGAPVDDKGEPVYHHVPKSYEAAASDGERWRWLLLQADRTRRLARPTRSTWPSPPSSAASSACRRMAYGMLRPAGRSPARRRRPAPSSCTR